MIRDIRFTRAGRADVRDGLLGWVSCRVGDLLQLDGIAVRRTRGGALTLSFPERRDRNGDRHPYIRPIGDCARRAFEQAIFAAIHIDGAARGGALSGSATASHSAGMGAARAQRPRQGGDSR